MKYKRLHNWMILLGGILLCFYPFIGLLNAQEWVPIGNSKNQNCYTMEILESTNESYKVKISIHGFFDTQIVNSKKTYHRLSFYDGFCFGGIGEPELPAITQYVAIPNHSSYKVEISEDKWSDTSMGDLCPIQADDTYFGSQKAFTKSGKLYNNHEYIPSLVTVRDRSDYYGIEILPITICPFKYYPQKNQLAILTEFTLSVHFSSSQTEVSTSSPISLNPRFDNLSFVANSNIFPRKREVMEANSNTNAYNYLIIVGDISGVQNGQAMRNFRKWKAFKGLKTKVVSTSETGVTANSIKSYITSEYLNNPSSLRYVLLVGDCDKVPPLYVNSPLPEYDYVYSDYKYGCVMNDTIASISIGRFSSNRPTEIAHMINKTIRYESKPFPAGREILLVAHNDSAPNKYQLCSEEIRTYPLYYDSMNFTKAYGALFSEGGTESLNADVINYINSGVNIVNYQGHGSPTCWSEWNKMAEDFCASEIENMNNDVCGVFLSNTCQSGSVQLESSMLETFTRAGNGAVAFYGSTENTRTRANFSFSKLFFQRSLGGDWFNVGDISRVAHHNLITAYNSPFRPEAKHNAYIGVWGGDPSLELWTDVPQKFSGVTFDFSSSGYVHINVGNNIGPEGYRACAVSNNGDLLYVGDGLYDEEIDIPFTGDRCYFVISQHNYIPYVFYYDSSSNYVQNRTFDYDAHFFGSPLSIGYDVTESSSYGSVSVKNGANVVVERGNGVAIKNYFSVEKGATFEIK